MAMYNTNKYVGNQQQTDEGKNICLLIRFILFSLMASTLDGASASRRLGSSLSLLLVRQQCPVLVCEWEHVGLVDDALQGKVAEQRVT